MARFIDPRVDWAFKRIFGSEDTKECLITFLNGLFEDELGSTNARRQNVWIYLIVGFI